jgi:hypothetical protein
MPQISVEFQQIASLHGGDTGSIPRTARQYYPSFTFSPEHHDGI